MSTRKRGFIEIVGDILNVLNKNSLKKSHIASNCNLDLRAVTKYLNLIIKMKLVKKSIDSPHFKLTKKGFSYLTQYNNLAKLLENGIENKDMIFENQ